MKGDLDGDYKLNLLRAIALVVVVVGAVGSIDLMLSAGRNNPSILLVGLFAIWVLSPFIALILANGVSKQWSFMARVTLLVITIAITAGSLVIYSGALEFGTKPAFKFLAIPLISWILMASAYVIIKFRKTK